MRPTLLALAPLLACLFAAGSPTTSNATTLPQAPGYPVVYKVQVEYWFFDTDYTYWKTVFETEDRDQAEFVYGLLVDAKEDGELNSVVPNEYWRYIAVDVRMVATYQVPNFRYGDLIRQPIPISPDLRIQSFD